MIYELFEIIGLSLQLMGALYAIIHNIPFLWNIIKQTYPFKQIEKGLEKLTHKTLDEKLKDVFLRNTDEGFKEIFNIINQKFGPYPEDINGIYFECTNKQRTVDTSSFRVVFVRYNDDNEYPTTRRDLLFWIDFWRERFLIVNGFKLVFFGTIFQVLSIIIQYFARA